MTTTTERVASEFLRDRYPDLFRAEVRDITKAGAEQTIADLAAFHEHMMLTTHPPITNEEIERIVRQETGFDGTLATGYAAGISDGWFDALHYARDKFKFLIPSRGVAVEEIMRIVLEWTVANMNSTPDDPLNDEDREQWRDRMMADLRSRLEALLASPSSADAQGWKEGSGRAGAEPPSAPPELYT